MGSMARVKLTRRLGPVGTALTLWDLWRRLPKRQRKWVVVTSAEARPASREAGCVYTARAS